MDFPTRYFMGEHSSILSNKTWVGVVPGAVTPPRLDLRPWPSENNGAGCLVGVHSGPDTHDHPQVIIHAPNNPFGHTDEMWGEHPTRVQCASGRWRRSVRQRLYQSVHLGRPFNARRRR